MKTLLVLRHAKSSWSEAGMNDHDRPLNERGKHDAPRIGQMLVERGIVPELTLSSTAKRARKTAQKALEAANAVETLELLQQLYLAHPEHYVTRLQSVPDGIERVMVVGHNPGLEELVEGFTGQPTQLPTAALVQLQFPIESWSELRLDTPGQWVFAWSPKSES